MDARLTAHDVGGATVLWDASSGRGFRAPDDPRARAVLTSRLGLDADRTAWIPHRSRHVLTLPDALWGPLPLVRTPGGHAYREIPGDLAIWRAINDSRTVADVARRADRSVDAVRAALRAWGAIDTQAITLWPSRVPAARLRYLVRPERPDAPRDPDAFSPDGATALGAYHARIEADGQFDDRETTVAHALALPHPGLRHRPYGLALREALASRGFETDGPVVEIGCGTGELAAAWGAGASYLRVDLSPALLAAQARLVPDSPGMLGDATALTLPDASARCVISNEVLADLPSRPTDTGWDNHGARAFVDELARVLAPGGRAFLSEFGTLGEPVEEARQLDHPEVAIDFLALAEHARTRGLHAEIVELAELLGLDPGAEQLARHSWHALRALAAARNVRLQARAWTRQTLALPWPVDGLDWTTLADEGPGPLITRFYALLLERP